MRAICGAGTNEDHWRGWLADVGWPPARPPSRDRAATPRAVVLAAHPDDEVLGVGGLLHLLARTGWRTDVVWASDGEASHPASTALPRGELARRRRAESLAARAVLDLRGHTTWLALPDSALAHHEAAITTALGTRARDADLLLAPWRDDGHPDHEVCGRAAASAASRHGCPLWEFPVWAWHWATADELGPRWPHAADVHLGATARAAKAAAIAEFVTQTEPLGQDAADAPVLPAAVLARFTRPVEVVLCSPGAPTPRAPAAAAAAARMPAPEPSSGGAR